MSQVHVIDHPLVQHKLTLMRNKNCGTKDFRQLLEEVAMLMAYEVTRSLPLKEIEIETPIAKCKSKIIAGKKLGIVPILRAGLGMVDGRDGAGARREGRPHRAVSRPGDPSAHRILLQASPGRGGARIDRARPPCSQRADRPSRRLTP